MHKSPDTQKKIIHRLKIARGHLNKVIEMVEADEYCIDIIHQSEAVQSALKEADNAILDNHLHSCVIPQIKDGKTEAVDEILEIFKRGR